MLFHIEENRGWLRSHTHTLVFERDPDFRDLAGDLDGSVVRWLRIWVEGAGGRPSNRSYIGCVGLCPRLPSRRELAPVFRRMGACADRAGQSRRVLRRHLSLEIRQRLQPAGPASRPTAEPDSSPAAFAIPQRISLRGAAAAPRSTLSRILNRLWKSKPPRRPDY